MRQNEFIYVLIALFMIHLEKKKLKPELNYNNINLH